MNGSLSLRSLSPARIRGAFTLIELLVVLAIISVLAAILFPVFAAAREKARQTACASNLRQIGLAFAMYESDWDGRLPDRRDLKITLGYRPWTTWPPSDPRGGWAVEVMSPYAKNTQIWSCPSVAGSVMGEAAQVRQGEARCWLWRFDRIDDPVPLTDGWGKTENQLTDDLKTANDPTIVPRQPDGPSEVELAVDPYFPRTIPTAPTNLKGRAVHMGGRNRVFLDSHVKYLKDVRTQ